MSEYAVFWIICAVVLGVVESVTVNLVTIWFAIGAFAAFITAVFTDSVLIQTGVFAVVSVITMVFTRPALKRLLEGKTVPTNADRFVGAEAVVTEEINDVSGSGKIKAMGQIWSAKSEDKSRIETGETVIINKIEGVRAVVSKKV